LSQAFSDRNAVRWDTARALAPKVIMQFAKGSWSQGSILNINFQDVPVGEVGPIEAFSRALDTANEEKDSDFHLVFWFNDRSIRQYRGIKYFIGSGLLERDEPEPERLNAELNIRDS